MFRETAPSLGTRRFGLGKFGRSFRIPSVKGGEKGETEGEFDD